MTKPTRITEHGRVSIPPELRDRYDLAPGDEVVWIDTDAGLRLKKRTRTGGRGLLVPDDVSREQREEVADELSRRVRERRRRTDEEQ